MAMSGDGPTWNLLRKEYENTFGAVGWGRPQDSPASPPSGMRIEHRWYPPGSYPVIRQGQGHTTPVNPISFLPEGDSVSESFHNLRTAYVNQVLTVMFDDEVNEEEKFEQIQVLTANLITTMIAVNQQRAEQELEID